MLLVFLSGGLFLGWSLGANDAANVFGTAVGTKMLRFKVAALICSIFLVLGAVIGGAGASHTLGKLGSVNAIAGSFMVAFSAAFTVFWMTRLKIPVSTSQAIVGAIIGWNLFSGSLTDYDSLSKIVITWVASPILAAVVAIISFIILRSVLRKLKIHVLRMDMNMRVGLLVVGAFGSYSLGANNIANVMGVFIPVSPFDDLNVLGLFTLSGAQQLFFIGAVAISVGVFTYSRKVMDTVGSGLFKLSPETALIVVLAHSIVLFLFSSEGLEGWLIAHHIPPIPLVPVSSSQAVVGAILGIGIFKGGKGIKFNVLGGIASGWVLTPLVSGLITFVALFFLQNVFDQEVSRQSSYVITAPVVEYLESKELATDPIKVLMDEDYGNASRMQSALRKETSLDSDEIMLVIEASERERFYIDPEIMAGHLDTEWLTREQTNALKRISGQTFEHKWQLNEALERIDSSWSPDTSAKPNKKYNKELRAKQKYIYDSFRLPLEGSE